MQKERKSDNAERQPITHHFSYATLTLLIQRCPSLAYFRDFISSGLECEQALYW